MPPVAILVLNAIQAAIAAAPQVVRLVQDGKRMIDSLFSANLITKEQQDILMREVDAISARFLAGQIPPAWNLEPDPAE